MVRTLKNYPKEVFFWSAALVFLFFFADPGSNEHYTICISHHLSIHFCPGCGLGRSIALLFDGKVLASLKMHPFGLPALIIITHRIFILAKKSHTYAKSYRTSA